MSTTDSITKPSCTEVELTESIQQSLLDHGVNKARVTLEVLGLNTKDPCNAASGVDTSKSKENNVEVIILNRVEQGETDRSMDGTGTAKVSNDDSNAFMYSSEVIGINKDQLLCRTNENEGGSPACMPLAFEVNKMGSQRESMSGKMEENLTGQVPTPVDLSGQGKDPTSRHSEEQHEEAMLPKAALSQREGEEPALTAAADDDPMTLEDLAMMMDDNFLPDDVKKMMEREKNKKERIKILNTFVGKSVLLDYKKTQEQRRSLPPPISSKLFVEAAMRAQMKRNSSAERQGTGTDGCPAPSEATQSPHAGAGGIQVLRFTLPTEDQARSDAVDQLRGSAAGEQHISAKDKYRLMMDDQQRILKRNDTSRDEYEQLRDKAIEYNRYLMQQ